MLGLSGEATSDFGHVSSLSRRELLEAGTKARQYLSSRTGLSDRGGAGQLSRTADCADFVLLAEGRLVEEDPRGLYPAPDSADVEAIAYLRFLGIWASPVGRASSPGYYDSITEADRCTVCKSRDR